MVESDARLLIQRKGRLPGRALVCRAAGTAVGFALGQGRDRGFVLAPQEMMGGDGLESLAFDGGVAPGSSSQSLENPHRVLR
jgi:hypothetical protein